MNSVQDSRAPMQLCEDEAQLFGLHSRMYFTGLSTLPWRTQLRSGALPLNQHVKPLVMSLNGPRRTELQALLWPHILHHYNVFYIDNPLYTAQPPPEYTNTLDSGFIAPMLLRIASSCGKRNSNHMYTDGPLAVVVTASLEESLAVEESIHVVEKLLDRDYKVVNIFETKNDAAFQQKSLRASESCDVLVVTMSAVLQLFLTQGRLGSPPINVLKVELVVLRNIDVMLRMSAATVDQMMTRFLVNSETNFVFAASSPSHAVRKIVKRLEGTVSTVFTVVTNMLDAVLLEKVPIEVREGREGEGAWSTFNTFNTFSAFSAFSAFADRPAGERIILFVGSDKHVVELKKVIEVSKEKWKTQYDFETPGAGTSFYDSVGRIREWWKTEEKDKVKLLAIPDGCTTDFGIHDADMAIHLSAPADIQQFMKRFCCIKDSFAPWARAANPTRNSTANPVANQTGNQTANQTENPTANPTTNPTANPTVKPTVPCRIVVDESWRSILPLLVHIAGAAGEYSVVPSSVVKTAQTVLQEAEFLRVPPCLQQLYIGHCLSAESCAFRHYQGLKVPLASAVGQAQSFKFCILRFLNPSHFLVRLLSYKPLNTTEMVEVDRVQKHLDELLTNILDELPEPLKQLPSADVICGMLSKDGKKLHRVQILKRLSQDFVHVFYVDEGVGMPFTPTDCRHPKFPAQVQSTANFYPLPEAVKACPKTWTNLIVTGVQPSALEGAWRPAVCGDVYTSMKDFIRDRAVMEGRGVFCTEDFVFVENFKCWRTVDGNRTCMLQMKNILNRFAGAYVPNLDHLEKLRKSYEAQSVSRGQSTATLLPLYPRPLQKTGLGEGDASTASADLSETPSRSAESS